MGEIKMFLKKILSIKLISFIVFLSMCICFFCSIIKVIGYKENESNLFGKIIYIDAGHGGKDNGAVIDDVLEDEINMKISGYLAEQLVDLGVYVLMSRTADYDLSSIYNNNKKREDLNNRVKHINSNKPDLFISIHLNSYSSSNVYGGQVFYQDNNASKTLADVIQSRLNTLNNKVRKIKKGDYFILNKTKYPGVIVECGFLSNVEERKKLNETSYQMKIANAIKKGIIDYYNN